MDVGKLNMDDIPFIVRIIGIIVIAIFTLLILKLVVEGSEAL